jgi:hypothetical protein
MKVLLEFDIKLVILYSEAAAYYPTKEQALKDASRESDEEAGDLYKGVSSVTVSDEHPGYHVEQLPDCLMLFPGFTADRSRAVISEVDASLLLEPGDKVVWLLGVPHLECDLWRLDIMRQANGIRETAPQLQVQTFDYRDSMRKLEAIYQERVGWYKITLSPMGSKMQALGAALFCHSRPDVRVVFATPKEYNASRYSEGCKARWKVDFGRLGSLRKVLQDLDILEVKD